MDSAFTDSDTTSSRQFTSAEIETLAGPSPDLTGASGTSAAVSAPASTNCKSKAPFMQRPNENLVISVVAKRTAGGIDPAAECGLGDDPTIPDRLDQFI